MPRGNNTRVTPDAVRDYNLNPAASVVDKQSKYTPQLEESAKLKQTADGLAKLAKGINDVRYIVERQANDNAIAAVAKTEEKNRKEWAEVSKNIDGMAKFNPYNKEAYKTLRAKNLAEQGMLKLNELKATCASLTPEEFDAQNNAIQQDVLNNMSAEGLKAKHTSGYLMSLHNASEKLKGEYVSKNAEFNYNVVQNQIISSVSKDMATMTTENPNGFVAGWNDAIKSLENTANGLGMNQQKQAELFAKTVNQYLVDNVDDIDAEEFIIAVSQTKINGQHISDFDPNYAESMKQLLMKAKRAKYESDSLDLNIEKLRLEKASLVANAEMFAFLSDPNKTDAEILSKANELIEAGGMEAIGMDYLKRVASDKQTLLNLRTTQTNPEAYEELMRKYITGELTQNDIVQAVDDKQLGAKDASSLFNALQSDAQQSYSEQLSALKELYLDANPAIELGDTQKRDLTKAVYDTIADKELTKAEKAQALMRIKGVAEHMQEQKEVNESKDPRKLLTASYMQTQKAHNQTSQEAQRYLAQMGLFKNQMGWKDSNIKVSSPMQASRTVTGTDGKTVTREHKGTDVSTYTGRAIYAPKTGEVIASGYEKSMGNYVLFKCQNGGYIKLMHLQAANLPKAGTHILEGSRLAHVGNSGFVNTKDSGVLHIECFDKRMRLVDPKQFIKGK